MHSCYHILFSPGRGGARPVGTSSPHFRPSLLSQEDLVCAHLCTYCVSITYRYRREERWSPPSRRPVVPGPPPGALASPCLALLHIYRATHQSYQLIFIIVEDVCESCQWVCPSLTLSPPMSLLNSNHPFLCLYVAQFTFVTLNSCFISVHRACRSARSMKL